MKGHIKSDLTGLTNCKTIFLVLVQAFCKLTKLVYSTAVSITHDRNELAAYLNVISFVWQLS